MSSVSYIFYFAYSRTFLNSFGKLDTIKQCLQKKENCFFSVINKSNWIIFHNLCFQIKVFIRLQIQYQPVNKINNLKEKKAMLIINFYF